MEEQVIQETPVASSEQPVAETTNAVNIDVSAYEQKIQTLQQRATEAEEKFQGIKGKLDDVYKKQDDQRRKTLEDQGQWKDLWEEANKTAQGKDQQIADLQRLIGQDIAAMAQLFEDKVIDREEFREMLVQGEILPTVAQAEDQSE